MTPYKNDKEFVDDCVGSFFATSDSALHQARGAAAGFDGITAEQAVQAARLAWSGMSRARLFCVRPEQFLSLYHASDRYTEKLAGLEWRPARVKIRAAYEDIDLNLYCSLWGVTKEQAEILGYFHPEGVMEVPDFEGLESFKGHEYKTRNAISKAGWEALSVGLSKLPKYKQARLLTLLQDYMTFRRTATKKDRNALIHRSDAIEDVLYDETEEETERLLSVYEDYGVHWPFPETMPFDSCFFSFGRRFDLSLSPMALHTRIRQEQLDEMGNPPVFLVGYLLAWEGSVPFGFAVLQMGAGDGFGGSDVKGASSMGLIRMYEDEEWTQPMSLDPWIVTMMVRAVNEHKQIIQDYAPTLSNRMDRKKASKLVKQLLPMPAPFYMVHLKDELIVPPKKKPSMKAGRPVEWSHRWDVRGHECVRVELGEMPMDTKAVARLKKRGYRIYEGMSLSADDAARLLKRGVRAPGPQQWIAVLSYWREASIKGPENRPYVPAARTGI